MVDAATRSCQTVLGSGKPGNQNGSLPEQQELNEPGGLCVDPEGWRLYIADTNNHAIKVWDLESQEISVVGI